MAIVTTDNQHYADIADAIREKNGSSDQYRPDQMAGAISDIQTGTIVQEHEGSFTTNESGQATVNLGFAPDVVYCGGESIIIDGTNFYTSTAVCFPYAEVNDKTIITSMLINNNVLVYFIWERKSTGFTVQVVYNWSATNVVTIDFHAVKFT